MRFRVRLCRAKPVFVFDAAAKPDGMNTENRRGRGERLKPDGDSTDSIAHRASCRGVDFRDPAEGPAPEEPIEVSPVI